MKRRIYEVGVGLQGKTGEAGRPHRAATGHIDQEAGSMEVPGMPKDAWQKSQEYLRRCGLGGRAQARKGEHRILA